MEYNFEESKVMSDKADYILKTILGSGKYGDFIRNMVNHSNFSLKNQALIMEYYPEATELKGMRSWNYIGRYVKDNESGTPTLSPVFEKNKQNSMDRYNHIVGFRVKYLFDVSQTAGITYKSPRCSVDEIERYKDIVVEALENNLSWKNKDGQFVKYSLAPVVANTNNVMGTQEEKTKAFILAVNERFLSRKISSPYYKGLRETDRIGVTEVMASAVNYITLTRFGFESPSLIEPDLSDCTVSEYEKLIESLNVIRQTSQSIINCIEMTVAYGRKVDLRKDAKESFEKLEKQGEPPFPPKDPTVGAVMHAEEMSSGRE